MTAALEEVERFRALLERRVGLVFDDAKLALLREVLDRRCQVRGLAAESYLASLVHDSRRELAALAEELTVGETYFFRNRDQFTALEQVAVPERLRARADMRQLRVLSAGCATGEEPFSLAIALRAALPDRGWTLMIRAVDLNPAALRRAARGRFGKWALREMPAAVERAWFTQDGTEYVLDESIRAAVRFEERNLVDDDAELWLVAEYDVIFCRNVLMYFAPETARAVVARIERSLADGGYLFLGHAETLRGLSSAFQLCHTHGTFYYQRRGVAGPAPERTPPDAPVVDAGAGSWADVIQRAADRIRALSVAPSAPVTMDGVNADVGRAHELLREERYAEALEVLAGVPANASRDIELLRAVLLVHSGRLVDAEQACHGILARDQLDAGAHYVLALCREGAGDLHGAADHDQTAVYLDGTFAMPHLHLGLIARRIGDLDAARSELRQAWLLLEREDAARVLLFGGGFQRDALIALCKAELAAVGGGR